METLVPAETGIDAYAPAWQESIELTPGTEFSSADLQRAYEAVAARMEKFIQSSPGSADFERVMKQLKYLESVLDKTLD